MANNFLSTEVTLSNNSETDIITTTSNKQILIGFTAANKTTTSLTQTVKINDGSSDFVIVNAVSIPPNSKIEILKGKFVLGTGYKLKATSSDSSGNVDIVMGLLTDVSQEELMEEKDSIVYVGQTPGVDNVDNYHKKDLKRDVFIEGSSNAVFAGPFTVSATLTIESGATVVIV